MGKPASADGGKGIDKADICTLLKTPELPGQASKAIGLRSREPLTEAVVLNAAGPVWILQIGP
jgi:hypothetical protein